MSESSKAYWEKTIKDTKHKVIGFINGIWESTNFFPISPTELSDEEFAAIIKEYRENSYFYSGEEYQESLEANVPVLDNYRYVDFSRRGFGKMMALAQGDYSSMGYASYTEKCLLPEIEKKFPKKGLKEDITHGSLDLEVTEGHFNIIKDIRINKVNSFVLLPIDDSQGYYWTNDLLKLYYGGEVETAQVSIIAKFRSEEEFKEIMEVNEYVTTLVSPFEPNRTYLFLDIFLLHLND